MAFDAFIKMSSIEGESQDDRHKGCIEVVRYGFVVSQRISRTASSCGGATAERADFSDMVFKKDVDLSSPMLTLACAEGRHIDAVELDICRAGGNKVSFMKYKLKNCLISHVSALKKQDYSVELVRVNFGAIQWIYSQQNRTGGSTMGNVVSGWNLETNSKF